jgi:hypothetical protein
MTVAVGTTTANSSNSKGQQQPSSVQMSVTAARSAAVIPSLHHRHDHTAASVSAARSESYGTAEHRRLGLERRPRCRTRRARSGAARRPTGPPSSAK